MVKQELKETITSLAVMSAIETEPKRLLDITGELINWTTVGLTTKYGCELTGLDKRVFNLINHENETSYIRQWENAVDLYNAHKSFWESTLKICHQVSRGVLEIAVNEDLIDYSEVAKGLQT